VNWQKTKVQALGTRVNVPLTVTVQDQEVTVVDQFVYLGSVIHSSTQSTSDIIRCSGMTCAVMQSRQSLLEVSTSLCHQS